MLPAPATACVNVSSWPLPVGPLTTPLLTKLPLTVALPEAVRTFDGSTDAGVAELRAVQGRQAAAVAEVRLAAENGCIAGKQHDRIAADVERAADARSAALVELARLRRGADVQVAGGGHGSSARNGPLDLRGGLQGRAGSQRDISAAVWNADRGGQRALANRQRAR